MRCPFATWQPVVNYTPVAIAHIGVVIHVTAGESNPWGWFDNPTSQASSHFFIGNGQGGVPDGALFQYVDTDLKAWAEAAGNTSYISVETEGEPTEPLTAAQIATFAKLYAWCHEQYGIPFVITDTPGAPGFITHGDGGVAWGDHLDCPGPLRAPQRQAILAAANPPAPTPAPTQEDDMQIAASDPRTGGVWVTDANGDLYAYGGAPFVAGLNQHPDYHAGAAESGGTNPCVGIAYWSAFGNDGILYITKPTSGVGGWTGTPYNVYRFLRSGNPA